MGFQFQDSADVTIYPDYCRRLLAVGFKKSYEFGNGTVLLRRTEKYDVRVYPSSGKARVWHTRVITGKVKLFEHADGGNSAYLPTHASAKYNVSDQGKWKMTSRDLILDEQRKAIMMEYPAFKDKAEVLPTLGRIVFESDSEHAQKVAIQEGGIGVIPKWEQCSPYTQARFERMGVKIANVLIEKCADQIDAMRRSVDIVAVKTKGVQSQPDGSALLIEDAEIVEEKQ